MLYSTGIVLIDNEKKELDQLRDAFYKAGLPCLSIKYNNEDPENLTGIDHVSIPESVKIRILFLDLNLQESQNLDAVNLVGPIAKVIKRLSPKGPFALIFWSKHKDEPEKVMEYLEERFSGLPLPITWDTMDKAQFRPIKNEKKINELRQKITAIMNHNPLFSLMTAWEGKVSEAARTSIESLYNLARPEDPYSIIAHHDNVKKLFTAIANESLGGKNAKENPDKAINQGLMPVLDDRLSLMNNETGSDWDSCLTDIGQKIDLDDNQKAKLNSYFHIEKVPNDYPPTARGIFVELDGTIINDPEKKKKLEEHLGSSLKQILMEEFLSCKEGTKSDRKKVRQNTKLGFIEISAACDYAQKKVKLNRYILGAMIPIKYNKYTLFYNDKKEERTTNHEGIYRLPPIRVNAKDYIVKISFKYQIGTHDKNSWFGSSVFRIREQILADIVFRCAQYSSRPGIISFS